MEHEIVICKCENVEHQIVFSYFPEDNEREIYMSIYLNPMYGFFKRIWVALKYIFGYKSMYGHFDEIIIDSHSSDKLIKILKYLNPNVSILETKNSVNS